MFSKACEYGIRTVIFINSRSIDNSKVGIKEISQEIGSPEPFTAKVLQNLTKVGLISSSKGPNGGFFIQPEKTTTLLDIVMAIDGDELFTGCGLGISKCSEKKPCSIHNDFKEIRNSLKQMLSNAYIHDLTENINNGYAFLKK